MHASGALKLPKSPTRFPDEPKEEVLSILERLYPEAAGLIDLMADAKISIDGATVQIVIDETALSAMEDARLGPRLPRRGRPSSN